MTGPRPPPIRKRDTLPQPSSLEGGFVIAGEKAKVVCGKAGRAAFPMARLCRTVRKTPNRTTHNPMPYTLGQAAKAAGVAKSTISDACKTGKISFTKNEHGAYQIDAAELHRVYPPKPSANGSENVRSNDAQPHSEHPESSVGSEALRLEVEMLREQLAAVGVERERERSQFSDQIEDLRRRLDGEGEERRRLTAILTDQRPKMAEPDPGPGNDPGGKAEGSEAGRGWWSRLMGRG